MKRLLWVVAIAASLCTTARAAIAPNPYQLYGHARAVWLAQHYPEYVAYTIAVVVDERGVPKTTHYRAIYDATHDHIYMNGVSEEERAQPHVPTGTTITLEPKRDWMTLFKRHVGHPEDAVDFLGVPMLAPNYSFGIAAYVPAVATSQADQAALVEEIRRQFNDPMSAAKAQKLSDAEGLKEIGRVTSTDRDYAITFDGVDSVDGVQAYHLSLRPTHDPGRLRLRDLWVDTQTFGTVKLVTQGNFINSNVPWAITFATVNGAQYIASEQALAPVGSGRHLYERVTISFESLGPAQPGRYLWTPIAAMKNVLTEPQ
ncbi:MAG TPA: hypothetical protein VGG89_00900 [Candidatus Baltobacteraceae bacterium]|jgi:hypothetical protein